MLLSKGVNVSNDSCISQVQEGIIDCGTVKHGGMEDGKLSVMRGIAIEIWVGEESGMQGGTIDRVMLCTFPLKHDPISHWKVFNKTGDFFLSVLIDKDSG